MSFGIIIKGKRESGRRYQILTASQAARGQVSRQNRQEYDNEKRAKEIHNHFNGPSDAKAVAVAKMMGIDEHKAKKLINKKSKGMFLDGKIN